MKPSQKDTRVRAANLRISFPHIFSPDTSEIGGNKYSATFLWPKSDKETTDLMKKGIEAAKKKGVEKYGSAFSKVDKDPIHDGDAYVAEHGESKAQGYKGCWYFQAKTKNRPQVVDRGLNQLYEEDDVPAGSYVNAQFNFFPYNAPGNKGVSVSLDAIQKMRCRDEDRFVGTIKAEDIFEVEEEEDEDFGF